MLRWCISAAVLLLLVTPLLGQTSQNWIDCGSTSSKIVFTDFTVFPNPVRVRQNVHLRAIVQVLDNDLPTASMNMILRHPADPDPLMTVPNISLCTLTPGVKCPIPQGENIISFSWTVPTIAHGNYFIRFDINAPGTASGCLNFNVTVEDPSADNIFTSWYEAALTAPAHYEKTNINDRTIGDPIQVGPIGYFPRSHNNTFQWGRVSNIQGSEDLVPPYLDTSSYVWGLYGNMTEKKVHIASGYLVEHHYRGYFFVGYIGALGIYNTPDDCLFKGEFNLTWSWNATTGRAALDGILWADPESTLPPMWPVPLTFGRLNPHEVITDDSGILKVRASRDYCIDPSQPCELGAGAPVVDPSTDLNDTELGLTIGLILGFAFLVVIIVGALLYMRHKRAFDEEDGVFAVSRKPEYGSALVVDDIIQETKEHSGGVLPKLDRAKRLKDLDLSEYSSYDSENGRGDRRSRRGKDRRTRNDPASSRSRSRTPSGSERSRSRSSSVSPASRGSPSRSRSRTKSITDSDSYTATDSARDSSRSRDRSPSFSGSDSDSGTASSGNRR